MHVNLFKNNNNIAIKVTQASLIISKILKQFNKLGKIRQVLYSGN